MHRYAVPGGGAARVCSSPPSPCVPPPSSPSSPSFAATVRGRCILVLYLEEQHRGGKMEVIEDGSVAWNRSMVNELVCKFRSSTEVQDEYAAIAAMIAGAELKWMSS